jgi:S1-C subfamily serine protease
VRLLRLLGVVAIIATVAGAVGTVVYLRLRPTQLQGRGPQVVAGQAEGAVNAAQKASPAVVRVSVGSAGESTAPVPSPGSSRTGIVIDPHGYVLTAEAAIAGAPRVLVAVPGGSVQDARIIGTDPVTGLTLLKVDANNLKSLSLTSTSALEVGTGVVTLTAPPGAGLAEGAVASVALSVSVPDPERPGSTHYLNNLLSLDVSPRDGQLGAPLLDGSGRVVGMIVAVGTLDVAVDMSDALAGVQQLMERGHVSYPSLGFDYRQLTSSEAADRGVIAGVLVLAVPPGSGADSAGLHLDDVITTVNSTALDSAHPLQRVLRGLAVDQNAALTVHSTGPDRQLAVKVELVTR